MAREALRLMVLGSALATSWTAEADMIQPSSYDMINGGTGGFSYHDDAYNGSGNPGMSYSFLSGGLGDLTNGVVATQNWNSTPGPYVGWSSLNLVDPVVTFHFAVAADFDAVRVFLDDSDGGGGVTPPVSVTIGGMVFPVTDPSGSAPVSVDFDVSGLSGDTLQVRFNHRTEWIMVSEVQFFGTPIVPEPGSVAMLGTGLLALIGYRRRLRRAA